MPTAKPVLQRLSAQIDHLVERLTLPKRNVKLTVWCGELPEVAKAAYFANNPTHRGEIIEFQIIFVAWMDRKDAKNRGWE